MCDSTSLRWDTAQYVQQHATTVGATVLLLIASPQSASAGNSLSARQTSGQVSAYALLLLAQHRWTCMLAVFMQGELLNQLLEPSASSGIKAQGPAAKRTFQVITLSGPSLVCQKQAYMLLLTHPVSFKLPKWIAESSTCLLIGAVTEDGEPTKQSCSSAVYR